ncbi:MAG: hypothetical protein K0R83_1842 [Caulobacter sp.]|nr:hypothetical protein [Caulobacter sp.]
MNLDDPVFVFFLKIEPREVTSSNQRSDVEAAMLADEFDSISDFEKDFCLSRRKLIKVGLLSQTLEKTSFPICESVTFLQAK